METQASVAAQPSGTRALAFAMFAVLLGSYAINAMDRQLFPLVAPEVRQEYGFSLAAIGLLSTIFTLGMAIAGLPTGYLLTRFSRKRVLQVGIAIFSAGTMLTVFSTGFSDMLLYRAATGIGEAMQLTVLLAIAANYFVHYRAAAIGAVNLFFGIGAIIGPMLGGVLLGPARRWHVPMVVFGALGFAAIAVVAVSVRRWFSETQGSTGTKMTANALTDFTGAATLVNRNTMLLTLMSLISGLVIYGYLRNVSDIHAGRASLLTDRGRNRDELKWIGSARVGGRRLARRSLFASFPDERGFPLRGGSGIPALPRTGSVRGPRDSVIPLGGLIVSGTIYVNLAGYHVKAVRSSLASRASGIFVTSLYASAAGAGYLMGWIASHAGWMVAGEIQFSVLAIVGAGLALALRPDQMCLQ